MRCRSVIALIGLGFFFLAPRAIADEELDQILNEGAEDKRGHSVAPVVGYEPTFGFVFGGAYFYQASDLSIGTDFNLNFKQVYQFHLNVTHQFAQRWTYELYSGTTKGYDPYYGEGGETLVSDYAQLWGIKSRNTLKISYYLSKKVSFGIFADVRVRAEEAGQNSPWIRQFPDEFTPGVGVSTTLDTRRNKQDPKDGFMLNLSTTYVPGPLSSLPDQTDFTQAQGTFIVYQEILKNTIPDVIAAYRISGGTTIGTPTYLYKYRLGGSDELPGYLENRFRGKKFYLQQTELRFPVWKMFSGAGFIGFGDATDFSFTNPKLAYGAGIRIGLPPNWVSKIRIDFAVGRDQSGVFADFGQSF